MHKGKDDTEATSKESTDEQCHFLSNCVLNGADIFGHFRC